MFFLFIIFHYHLMTHYNDNELMYLNEFYKENDMIIKNRINIIIKVIIRIFSIKYCEQPKSKIISPNNPPPLLIFTTIC